MVVSTGNSAPGGSINVPQSCETALPVLCQDGVDVDIDGERHIPTPARGTPKPKPKPQPQQQQQHHHHHKNETTTDLSTGYFTSDDSLLYNLSSLNDTSTTYDVKAKLPDPK